MITAWTAGAVMVLAMVADASWAGLVLTALAAVAVILGHWTRRAAVPAVQLCALGLALNGTSAALAAVAGLAATVFLLTTYLRSIPAALAPMLERALPMITAATAVAVGAVLLPTGPGWLAVAATPAVVVLFAGTVLPYRRRVRT